MELTQASEGPAHQWGKSQLGTVSKVFLCIP